MQLNKEQNFKKFLAGKASETGTSVNNLNECIKLLDDGCTVPFIARYRKERTGGMVPETIYHIQQQYEVFKVVEKKKEEVLRLIQKSAPDKLSPELSSEIISATTVKRLEDLYLPFRPKRCTLAQAAREQGLEPLFQRLWNGEFGDTPGKLFEEAEKLVNRADESLKTITLVFQGISNLIAEAIAEDPDTRDAVRARLQSIAVICGKGTKQELERGNSSNFRDYLNFSIRVSWIKPHQMLALQRGESEKALKVKVDIPPGTEKGVIGCIQQFIPKRVPYSKVVNEGISESWKRLLKPTLTRALLKELQQNAEEESIKVFSENLRSMLLTPPVAGKRVMGVDPGFVHGCKVACLDDKSMVKELDTIFPQRQKEQAKDRILALLRAHGIDVVAVGNGTASRETQELVAQVIKENGLHCEYTVVSEAGASVYSASEAARTEFPDTDCTLLGAVSIGRRLIDPLSELVKVEPKSIGLGMYQHDISEKDLSKKLDDVVRDCVNEVGVLVNSASEHLLKYVSGLNKGHAKKIREYREQHGPITKRKDLTKIKGFGAKTFEQAAGFLRIEDGEEMLDNTRVHPESYRVAKAILKKAGVETKKCKLGAEDVKARLDLLPLTSLATELQVGEITLQDIVGFLRDPCPDPRTNFNMPTFRQDMMKIEDLQIGSKIQGTIRNIVPFGAFVDIGIGIDGLLHNSQIDCMTKDSIVLGHVLDLYIIGVEIGRKRISLSNRENWETTAVQPNRNFIVAEKWMEKTDTPKKRKFETKPAATKTPTKKRVTQPAQGPSLKKKVAQKT